MKPPQGFCRRPPHRNATCGDVSLPNHTRPRENRWLLTTSGILGQDRLDEQARDGRREAFRILLADALGQPSADP
jgi:hypothetical protein